MASYQDGSSLEFCHGHKREQSQDSGAYIDWNSEDSASPVGNPDNTMSEDFITVVAVENGSGIEGKKEETPFVTILAIGEAGENSGKEMQSGMEEEVLVYRLPGERLGFGLKFEGGTNTAENVKRLFIQSSAPDSPASRAKCSWGSLEEGDEILKIDGNVVKSMTRLDCVRCLKESSVVIKLHVRHKSQKAVQQGSRFKAENSNDLRANNTSSSSPTVVSAEMKKNIPPPPPVPPRKITKKNSNSVVRETMVNPPEGFCDMQNGENPKPKTRNMQNGPTDETSKNSSRYVIRVPQKANLDSPDLSKHTIKRNGSDSKLAPPEPKVYLDMLTQEDNRNGESESDDTCSTVSTVVGLSSVPNTTNSSFSDLRSSASSFCDSTNPSTPASSEPTTPVLELSRMLSPFDHSQSNDFLFSKLINGKDPDSISYDEKITNCADEIIPLQPPLSFQDAPLSYGNEEMRTNLSENLNSFQDESLSNCLKNHQDEITNERDSSGDGKSKDKNTILSKKPSLIPRLAKSIGLLSPPKPSPRKESRGDGGKSRFNKKKPPPLPPLNDKNNQTLQDDHENNKTLKSSIPYLKKKKNKNEDGKKNGKGEKKLKISEDLSKEKQNCSVNDFDSHHEAHENMINDADKNVSEILKTPETERSIMWEVPDMKDAAESNPDENENATTENNKENENSKIPADEPDKYLSDFENCKSNDKMNESCEPHFMFPWSGSKQLETIGEDEEVDDVTEKCNGISDKKEGNESIEKAEDSEKILVKKVPGKEEEIKSITFCEKIIADEKPTKDEAMTEENKKNEVKASFKPENQEIREAMENKDESKANGTKHKNALCNNHVLVKLDNDSLEVVKNVDLSTSNGEVKEAMVPVVSTTIGLVAPSSGFRRMPPDGHEFPQKYTEKSVAEDAVMAVKVPDESKSESSDTILPPLPTSDPPSTPQKYPPLFNGETEIISEKKFYAGGVPPDSTVVKPPRNSFWRQDEKSEKSVRDKIAMFSSVPDSAVSPANGSGKLSKYKSSDDVFYYDETDCGRNIQNGKLFSRSVMTLDKVSGGGSYMKKPSYGDPPMPSRSLDYSSRTQSSMDLSSSSSSAYSSSCSPDSSLSSNSSYLGYSSTLPRKKTRNEDIKSGLDKKDASVHRTASFSVHGRSQSLLDVNPTPSYKYRYLSENSQDDGQKPGSLNLLIEQRRKNLSKLRGLVIPEKLTDTMPTQPIVDLPEIRSRDLVLNSKVPSAYKERSTTNKWARSNTPEVTVPKVTPTHLWDMQNKSPNIPKYSPAFKRKSISVFGTKELLALNAKKEVPLSPLPRSVQEPLKAPLKPPRNIPLTRQYSVSDDRKYQDAVTSYICEGEISYPSDKNHRTNEITRSTEMYVPKRKSTLQGKYRLHSENGRSEEDSDNDSAVSSSRSSISHGFSPPASPLLDSQYQSVEDSNHRSRLRLSPDRIPVTRTLSSETTASAVSTNSTLTSESQASVSSRDGNANDASNKRILKPQSVEAINRKNVLASAKYSRGFDVKSGSPLIQRKFSEHTEEVASKNPDLSYSINRNHYSGKYSSNGLDAPKEVPSKRPIEKIAYITDVVDDMKVSEETGKKKLEKSESVPLGLSIKAEKTPTPRKTSVPYGYSWDNDNTWNQKSFNAVEQVPVSLKKTLTERTASLDKPADKSSPSDKDFNLTNSRTKFNKSPTDTSADSISSNDPVIEKLENSKLESKRAQLGSDRTSNGNRRSVSVNDVRKTFEKPEPSGPPSTGRMIKSGSLTTPPSAFTGMNGHHIRVSSLDSTTSDDGPYSFSTNLLREQFGSITSLASSTSLISPQELQLLIEEANQTLEESGNANGGFSSNNHDVLVIILYRDTVGGSIGITLAGGADYESKEITVHKVLAGSPADRDGRIQKGDRILSINGKSMKGVTHRESLAILKSPRLEVVLVVSRLKSDANSDGINSDEAATPVQVRHSFFSGSSRPPRILEQSTLKESDESSISEIARGPPVTLVLVKDGAGLGFSLEGGKDCSTGDKPLVIKKIFTGGTAEKSGQLKAGDELLNINGIDVSAMSRIEAWKLMKQLPDGNVTITVKHEVENKSVVQP